MKGVYAITNILTGKYYIGSSVNIDQRLINHFSQLRSGNHCNSELQKDFNEHGESFFQGYKVLECLSDEELIIKEQYYITLLDNVYNKRSSKIGSTARNKIRREALELKFESKIIRFLEEESRCQNRTISNLVETWIKEKIDLL